MKIPFVSCFIERFSGFGIFIIRLGIGAAFIMHGYPKMMAGPVRWTIIGSLPGLPFPTVFGFLAAFAEFFGGICLILGIFFRPACFLLLCTMIGALVYHIGKGDVFYGYSQPFSLAVVFLGLMLHGAGNCCNLDNKICKK